VETAEKLGNPMDPLPALVFLENISRVLGVVQIRKNQERILFLFLRS
jgi:hypothetical protein